jgi:RNA polymerase sigma-70 factor (ECF subfamily)
MYMTNHSGAYNSGNKISVDAFGRLFKKHYRELVLFAKKFTQDRLAAEDIVTDIFGKLWQRQLHFDTEHAARAFLFISTRNACINHVQRAAFQAQVRDQLLETSSTAVEDFVLNEMIRAEVMQQLMGCVDQLPTQCRKIMRMIFVQGYSCRQIAKKLQLSINTVRNQKARGIHLIRKRLSPATPAAAIA